MKILSLGGMLLLVMLAGCAGITASSRFEIYEDIQRAYRLALRDSDFKAAALVLDPAAQPESIDYHQYDGFKVVRYEATKRSQADGGLEIKQEVEIQYYHVNRPVVKTLEDHQLWRYQPDKKNWLLETGLPKFE